MLLSIAAAWIARFGQRPDPETLFFKIPGHRGLFFRPKNKRWPRCAFRKPTPATVKDRSGDDHLAKLLSNLVSRSRSSSSLRRARSLLELASRRPPAHRSAYRACSATVSPLRWRPEPASDGR